MLYKNTKELVHSSDSDTNFSDIDTVLLQVDTLTLYMFLIGLDFLFRTSRVLTKENGFTHTKKTRNRLYPTETNIYIYIYIYIYITEKYISKFNQICKFIRVFLHIYVHVYECVCVRVCVNVLMNEDVYVLVSVSVCSRTLQIYEVSDNTFLRSQAQG